MLLGFLQQSLLLGGVTVSVLGLLGIIGLGPVLTVFPRAESLRWPIYAPLVGLALLTVIGLPLARYGLPVNQWALVFVSCASIFSIVTMRGYLLTSRKRRLLYSYLQHRYHILIPLVIVPVLVSAFLLTYSNGGHVRDIWGSGDYGAYWILADYLQDHGANIESYQDQDTYFASDIQDHLLKHARLGCMVYLAFLGAMVSPTEIHHVINPSIVAAIILSLMLSLRWLELERAENYWVYAGFLLLYPFLYFLLYFTYASQATGVLLFLASLLLVGTSLPGSQGATTESLRRYILAGTLAGAALLHYPSISVAVVICWILLLVEELIRIRRIRLTIAWLVATLLVSFYYLPQIARELSWASTSSTLPGWDWMGLIGSLEFLGIRSVLGYDLPKPISGFLRLVSAAGNILLMGMLFYGMRLSRVRIATLTVVTATGLLVSVAFWKYLHHVPHASHAVVKTLSTFAPWLLIILLLPVVFLLRRRKHDLLSASGATIAAIVAVLQMNSLYYGSLQRPWYTDDLVTLSRRQLREGVLLRFKPDIHWEMEAPIVRDTRLLSAHDSVAKVPVVTILSGDALKNLDMEHNVDQEGEYFAVRHKPNE